MARFCFGRLLVIVTMVQVGKVGVGVDQRAMAMPMRMRLVA